MAKKHNMSFATVLCLIPENTNITGNGLATGCQLFYRKIYGYVLVVQFTLVLCCSLETYFCSARNHRDLFLSYTIVPEM